MRQVWYALLTVGALAGVIALFFAGGVGGAAHEGHEATPGTESVVSTEIALAHPAHIHQGPCDNLDPNPRHLLADVAFAPVSTPTSALMLGDESAIPTMMSVTTLGVGLIDLLAGPQALDVHASATDSTSLACGVIGGVRMGNELAVGLQEQSGSAHAGIAWLHANTDGTTTVRVFLAHGLAGQHAGAAGTPVAEASSGGGEAAGLPTALTVEAVDIDFNPDAFTVPAGTDVQVTMANHGAIPHTFTIDELGIDEILQPGETREITINAPAGDYTYYCRIPGHRQAGQVGTMTAA